MPRDPYLGLPGYDHWKTTEPDDWSADLCRREREQCGECVWCGAAEGEPCGQEQEYIVPRCVIEGDREMEDGE